MTKINWPDLIVTGLQHLGLRPDQFWALTPGELMVMLGVFQGGQAMTRGRLEALSEAFPDKEETENDIRQR